ncbi:aldehyde dehydrogenase domain-containing protein [Talaromyces proteolyticus]|uniref:Aldehyde dehydrogenase domain-containing protein n=1 Tax=Talaromyces proteolyticus TaxID=1131652 RepID=A0AAD4L0N5_9EURO|nr:aldehyde dehydrogenase domain-containing protein [Talaromyces proteolyticus]KAH8704063.1 aldehyde dehydrogenase domain-containing protein [Talaromyces proteolyticus]
MTVSAPNPVPLFIGNQPVTSSELFEVTNAGTGSTTQAYGATPDIVKEAIQSAFEAFSTWKETSPWVRRELFQRAAQILSQNKGEIANLLKIETPIDGFLIDGINIQLSIDLLEELACQMVGLASSTMLPGKNDTSSFAITIKEPLGVNVGIAPWNAALFLGLRAVATPIACGNTAILKASEMSPLVHHFIGSLFKEAGFPPGVLNIVQHRPEDAIKIVDALITDDRVRKINFTGSTNVGKIIASKAAAYGKPSLLELGGKAPMIVFEDANLDLAAEAAAIGAFEHHGQVCMSTERILVAEKVFAEFTSKLGECVRNIRASIYPGASKPHVDKVTDLISDAMGQGARNLMAENHNSETVERNGSRLEPIILTNVTREMSIWKTETFAPVAVLMPFTLPDEAISLANDCPYGLSSSIFSQDILKAIELAKRIDAGAVHINSITIHDEAHLPHGGTKASGWGRFGVPWGFSEFTQLKTITVSNGRMAK